MLEGEFVGSTSPLGYFVFLFVVYFGMDYSFVCTNFTPPSLGFAAPNLRPLKIVM
jgi:hypothetical protein